jgi:hypothetical protein
MVRSSTGAICSNDGKKIDSFRVNERGMMHNTLDIDNEINISVNVQHTGKFIQTFSENCIR